MSSLGNRYSNPQTSFSQARSDISTGYSAASTNASQLWNAQTYAQGYSAMQGPVGTAIQMAAPVAGAKALGLLGDVSKAGQATKLAPAGLAPATGRTAASTLNESILMRAVKDNPSLGQPLSNMSPLSDPNWKGWLKYEYKNQTSNGENVIIHYNTLLDDSGNMIGIDDFKFK